MSYLSTLKPQRCTGANLFAIQDSINYLPKPQRGVKVVSQRYSQKYLEVVSEFTEKDVRLSVDLVARTTFNSHSSLDIRQLVTDGEQIWDGGLAPHCCQNYPSSQYYFGYIHPSVENTSLAGRTNSSSIFIPIILLLSPAP